MYKYVLDNLGVIRTDVIQRTSDGAFIPFVSGNTDYIKYQQWLANGNTPISG